MPDNTFSSARLRSYRVLESAGLGEASDLLISTALIASHLWLPLSLIEIAFRNYVDQEISRVHSRGELWLIADTAAGGIMKASAIAGAPFLCRIRDDGSHDDPVAATARETALLLSKKEISRDDLVAHLMLGFWVVRVPQAFEASNPKLDVFDLVAAHVSLPLAGRSEFRKLMINKILRIRNRLAHHEPVLFRGKHVFAAKTGEAKLGLDLVTSLLGAVAKFEKESTTVLDTAKLMVPMATNHLDHVAEHIAADLKPIKEKLEKRRIDLTPQRDERREVRRSPAP